MKLILLSTPRYLAYCIAMLEKRQEKGLLVITHYFYHVQEYLDILNCSDEKQPFIEILDLCQEYCYIKKNYHRIKFRRNSLTKIKLLFNNYSIDTVITSDDGELYNQYALSLNKHGKNIYLEDGTGNYMKEKATLDFFKKPLFRTWRNQILFFKDFQFSSCLGVNPYINEIYLSYPDYATINYTKPTFSLSKEYFMYESLFINNILSFFKISKETLSKIDLIILLDFVASDKQRREQYMDTILDLCKKHFDKRIAIKRHPRDPHLYESIKTLGNTVFLPDVAFEFLIPLLSNTVIIGSASTATMLASMLNQQVFLVESGNDYPEIYNLFKEIGIENYENKK
jgi:hypothetical protein